MRTEWEYLELVATLEPVGPQKVFGAKRPDVWVIRYGGEAIEGIIPALNRAGEHGWELATVLVKDAKSGTVVGIDGALIPAMTVGPHDPTVLALILKRPIEIDESARPGRPT